MNINIKLPVFVQIIVLGILLCLVVAAYSLFRYPAILLPPQLGLIYASMFLIVLLFYFGIAWRSTRSMAPQAARMWRNSLGWGLLIAAFWLVEIVAGNLADPQWGPVRQIYFGFTALAFLLPLIAGMWGTRQSGDIRTGALLGLWSGMVSGLLAFLELMVITYLFLNTFLHDPQNGLQFQTSGAPDLVTFVIGDSLAGVIGHLVIGLILGGVLGWIGGVLAKVAAP